MSDESHTLAEILKEFDEIMEAETEECGDELSSQDEYKFGHKLFLIKLLTNYRETRNIILKEVRTIHKLGFGKYLKRDNTIKSLCESYKPFNNIIFDYLDSLEEKSE